MKQYKRSILITGGAGFIGSHVVRRFVSQYPDYHIVNLDKLTYAGNLSNLKDVETSHNYTFVQGDICDHKAVGRLLVEHQVDAIIHLAAESHVDRSISDPFVFGQTNVMGTLALLHGALKTWNENSEGMKGKLFYHISTDEVYGSLKFDNKLFDEESKYDPHSPYSASKASSDHFVRAYATTYGLPTLMSNCSNNYGPYQFPEKLIPLFIHNICLGTALPIYGNGQNVRDWLYVEDHARAIDLIFHGGKQGETYNIGGGNEWSNLELVKLLIQITDRLLGNPDGYSESLITFVTDRAGHDLRYAIDCNKLKRELAWAPSVTFAEGLERTIRWYLDHSDWVDQVMSERNTP